MRDIVSGPAVSRRRVVTGIAWSVPVVASSTALSAFAASGDLELVIAQVCHRISAVEVVLEMSNPTGADLAVTITSATITYQRGTEALQELVIALTFGPGTTAQTRTASITTTATSLTGSIALSYLIGDDARSTAFAFSAVNPGSCAG